MNNLIYDIFRNQIKKELDQSIQKLGIKIKSLLIEEENDLKIKVVLIEDTLITDALIEVI